MLNMYSGNGFSCLSGKKYMAVGLVLLFSLFYLRGMTQNQRLKDSLLQEVAKTKNDEKLLVLNQELYLLHLNSNLQQADSFARANLQIAIRTKNKSEEAASYLNLGRLFANKNIGDSAIYYYKKSMELSEALGYYEGVASNNVNIGNIYYIQSDWADALNYYNAALKILEKHDSPSRKITALANIAGVYFHQKDFIRAKEFIQKAMEVHKEQKNNQVPVLILTGMANIAVALKDTAEAVKSHKELLAFHHTTGDSIGIATTVSSLGLLEADPAKAITQLLQAQEIFNRVNPDDFSVPVNLGNLGKKHNELAAVSSGGLRLTLLNKAKNYLLQAYNLATKLNFLNYHTEFLDELADVEESLGNYQSAFKYQSESIRIKDSAYSQDLKNEIAQKANQYDLSLRDKQIEMNELALKNSRNQRLGLTAGILLLLVIGGLLYYQNQTRKKTNTTLLSLNNQLDEANKVKTKFFGILTHDLRSPIANLVNFLHLQKEAKDLLREEDVAKHQEKITHSAETLLENMEAMLLWSKSQMEKFKPQKKEIRVATLFHYLQTNFVQESLVKFSFFNPEDLVLFSDEDYLKTILLNLTNNAVKALATTPNAEIIWKAYRDKENIILSVTDNGPGVNEEQLRALHDEGAPVSGKTGLGLHIIRDLAKAINCGIVAEKDPQSEKGTVFTLSI